ncbi:hypothetical protein HPT25_12295 [Bacillus sp. BRMEA1]|uniref:hypothetical protein n=1 Tax=Neobacillus endophyticus TaxID=2738405 RepID=UPI00156681B4|nr:hypothetical protein [Neobacillus endophyticus]NRD78167.1 hypothetical protein [Neobacillus endophyticus]
MKKEKYTIWITLGVTFILFLAFHLSKEHTLSQPLQLVKHKLEVATNMVTDTSKTSNQHGEATVNDWDRLLHKVIDKDN